MAKYFYEVTYPNGNVKRFVRLIDIINHFRDFKSHEETFTRVEQQLKERGCSLKKIYESMVHRTKVQAERSRKIINDFIKYGEGTYGSMTKIDENDPKVKYFRGLISEMN